MSFLIFKKSIKMKKAFLLIGVFIFSTAFYAQNDAKPVFKAGEDGYESYRIPAIVKSPKGDLLAFSEGRVDGSADFGHVKIVMKRSKDNGKTWSDLQVIASNDTLQAGNAAPVVDVTDPDYPDGRIFLFYNTGNRHEYELRTGLGERKVWYKTSEDNGETWSDSVEISNEVKKDNWRAYANTPGHALQIQNGEYKGRIFVAANHSSGGPEADFTDYKAHGYYTDDHGKTFHLSETAPFGGGNENSAAELPDGKLMMNFRNQKGKPRTRIVAVSRDGGETWDKIYYDHNLPDPVNQGSILNVGQKDEENYILAFSNAADPEHRRNLTVRISEDNGETWTKQHRVDKKDVGTAYSDIVEVDDGKIGVLYERGDYEEIVFKVIDW